MKPIWLLDKIVFKEDHKKIIDALQDLGIKYKFAEYKPFLAELVLEDFVLPNKPEHAPVVPYGSIQMVQTFKKLCHYDTSFLSNNVYDCNYYYPRFRDYLLNSDYKMVTLGDFVARSEEVFETLYKTESDTNWTRDVFIRPNSGFKAFTGQVTSNMADIKMLDAYAPPETICLTSTPKSIVKEWRIVVGQTYEEFNDGGPYKIISSTLYKEDGLALEFDSTEGMPKEAEQFAEEVLSKIDFKADPFWTLDICEILKGKWRAGESDREYKVLEIGGFSSAGLYGCDIHKVVSNVSDFIEQEHEELL